MTPISDNPACRAADRPDPLVDACFNAAGHAELIDALHAAYCWCCDDSREPAFQLSREARAELHDAGWDGLNAHQTAERLEDRARELPLSVLVRSDWMAPDARRPEWAEFELLLTTGGPALRLVGRLYAYEPDGWLRLEVQDWGTPWTPYGGPVDRDALLWFAGLFWYGEGC